MTDKKVAEVSSPARPQGELVAGVMKKLLPPALLAEVLTYLDPLGTFEQVLKEQDK